MFSLAEELLLIALDDEKGQVVFSASSGLHYGLAGALLADLTIRERITIENKKLIVTDDEKQTGDNVLDSVLAKIDQSDKPKSVKHWVQKLANEMSQTKHDLLNNLVEKGVLLEKEEKVLWIFNRTSYPTENAAYEQELRNRIRSTVFGEEKPDARTAMLLSLIKACNLVGEVFQKGERSEAKKKIDAIIKNNEYGKAVSASIEAMQTAILVACTVAATSAATSSSAGS